VALSGFVMGMSYNIEKLWVLGFFGMIPFLAVMTGKLRLRERFWYPMIFGTVYFVTSVSWLYTFSDVLELTPKMQTFVATLALFLIGIYLSLYWAVLFAVFGLNRKKQHRLRYRRVYKILLVCCIFVLGEWLQGLFYPLAFPWARIGNIVTPFNTFIQSASLFGGMFISFLVLFVNGLLFLIFKAIFYNVKYFLHNRSVDVLNKTIRKPVVSAVKTATETTATAGVGAVNPVVGGVAGGLAGNTAAKITNKALSAIIPRKHHANWKLPTIIFGILVGANLLFGLFHSNANYNHKDIGFLNQDKAILIQGNYPGLTRFGKEEEMYQTYISLIRQGLEENSKKDNGNYGHANYEYDPTPLVITPEIAIPFDFWGESKKREELYDIAEKYNATIIIGGWETVDPKTGKPGDIKIKETNFNNHKTYDVEENPNKPITPADLTEKADTIQYNAVFAIYPNHTYSEVYCKQRLVPFAEKLMWAGLINKFFPNLLNNYTVTEGENAVVFPTNDRRFNNLAPLICYESIFPNIVREQVKAGGDLVTFVTDDSWFGDSAALWQHRSHSVMRAVENHVTWLQTSNTGITCYINDKGQIEQEIPINQRGTLTVNYRRHGSFTTLYTLLGDIPLVVFCVGVLIYGYFTGGVLKKFKIHNS
jgi:apolipoprotein N-acyltransferase